MSGMASRWWAEVSGADLAKRPPSVVVVLTEDAEQGGYFVAAYDTAGRPTVPTTWHGARAGATAWAESEHAPADIGEWREIPDTVADAALYARKAISRRG